MTFRCIFACLIVTVYLSDLTDQHNIYTSFDVENWTHHIVLDSSGDFQLYWFPGKDKITFEIHARTNGYVALGFSPRGSMAGADIFFAWIDENGNFEYSDTYVILHRESPRKDSQQDYTLLRAFENETHTIVRFQRLWNTCDVSGEDINLGFDTVRLIWAYGLMDPLSWNDLFYHGPFKRGTRSVYLREEPQPRVSQHSSMKTWNVVTKNNPLPSDDHTHYWCEIFESPPISSKHHMVGFEPIIQPGNEAYVHHMILYECHVDPSFYSSGSGWFSKHVGPDKGAACYSPSMPPEWSFCLATNVWAWAIGSEGETLPDHVGTPLGEAYGGATFFMLEIHYDNPHIHPGIIDNSGMKIFYTPVLRKYDTAMILVGSEVNFLHLIPPKQESFTSLGRCTSQCTKLGLKAVPQGINVLNAVLHSHLAGRAIRLRRIRNGSEIAPLFDDNSYDFNFQSSRKPRPTDNDVSIRPGDELLLECEYQTSNRSQPTFGGLSTRNEMCLAFILYYPRQPLADCRSLPTLKTVMKALGIKSIFGKGFEKLLVFMKNIGHGQGEDSLADLLKILMKERSNSKQPESLTEAELLEKPFYKIQSDKKSLIYENSVKIGFLSQGYNYRNLLQNLLLNSRIEFPMELRNETISSRFSHIQWQNKSVIEKFQFQLYFGSHNSLCMGHGRSPITSYDETPFPFFVELPKFAENINCINSSVITSIIRHLPNINSSSVVISLDSIFVYLILIHYFSL